VFCLETVLERIKHSYNTRFVKKSLIDEENNIINILSHIFRILADYRLRHLVKNVAMHIYTHDYIRMAIAEPVN
jgi:hypothetical protein